MATKKTVVKAKVAAKKTITVRSKDGKTLAGSISLGGKIAPTAKKTVEKKVIAAKQCLCLYCSCKKPVNSPDYKNVCDSCVDLHYDNRGGNIRSQENTAPEVSLNEIARENEELFDTFLADVIPYNPDFENKFSLTNLQVSVGVKGKPGWSEDILHNGVKVGSIENRDFGKKRYYIFDTPADKKAWKDATKSAYEDSDYENDADVFGYYLEYLAGYTKVGDV